jgi:two-component system alkaline phosphatase synthesis response regulator PhoP
MEAGSESKREILLADDDGWLALAIEAKLKSVGFEVHSLWDGSDLWTTLQSLKPDLLILSMQLPGVEPLEICRRIHLPAERHLPVILLTHHYSESDVVEALRLGAEEVVAKPLCLGELTARAESLLGLFHRPPGRG